MPNVLIACNDSAFCGRLRAAFQGEADFVIFAEIPLGPHLLQEITRLSPALVVLEVEREHTASTLRLAQAVKLFLPNVILFLIVDEYSMPFEKQALSCGLDAVFEKHGNLKSLVLNARALFGGAESP